MAEVQSQTTDVIAKEITLAAMPKVGFAAGEYTPERMGDKFGKLYKVILKHVREAVQENKYD